MFPVFETSAFGSSLFLFLLQEKHKPLPASKLAEKQKETLESSRSESRFKVVGGRRNIDVDELNDDNLFHLLDIVQEDWNVEPKVVSIGEQTSKSYVDKISCNGIELDVEKSKDVSEFVYDVYFHHRNHGNKTTGEIEICSPESIDQVSFLNVQWGSEKLITVVIQLPD